MTFEYNQNSKKKRARTPNSEFLWEFVEVRTSN